MLVLFSSGARERYREDIVRSLALPSGSQLQFRYEEAIVADNVKQEILQNGLAQRDGIICYLWNRTKGAPTSSIPCRVVRTIRAELSGTSVILTFTVQNFFQQSVDLTREIETHTPYWQRTSGDDFELRGPFLLDLPVLAPQPIADQLRGFEQAVSALCKFADYSAETGREFYHVRAIKHPLEGHPVEIELRPNNGQYTLRAGKVYDLEVYCFSPEQGPTATIESSSIHITSDSTDVEFPFGSEREIDSEYDLKKFRFFALNSPYSSTRSIRLFVKRRLRATNGKPVGETEHRADIILPIRFKGDKFGAAIRVLALAIGASGPAMVAAYAAGKLDWSIAILMVAIALCAGGASVFSVTGRRP